MRRLFVLAVPMLMASCGEAPPRAPAAGPEARKAVDTATEAYADCIENGARNAAPGGVPGTIVEAAVKACAPARDALADKVMAFHKIGHPKFTLDQLRAVADASIEQVEPEMKADAVVAYVARTEGAANQKAQ